MLDITDVRTGYVGVPVIQGVFLGVGDGQITALLGANGAGKSTLIKAVSGLIRIESGTVSFNGEDITNAKPHRIAERGLIQVPQGRRLFTKLSVVDNLLIGNTPIRAKSKRRMLLDRVFELFPILAERRQQYCGTLSGGQQQMVAIGRALMSDPMLLILDEPSIGLAPAVTDEVMRNLVKLNGEGLSIFLIEQNVGQALGIADHAYILENGTISLEGPAEVLRNDERVRKAYLGV